MSEEEFTEETKEETDPQEPQEIEEGSLSNKIDELESTLKRTMADFDNYRKRMLKDRQRLVALAAESLVKDILPVLDDLERVTSNHGPVETDGINMIYRKLKGALEDHGLETIESEGQEFDPYTHECVVSQEVEEQEKDDIILEELQRGYKLNSNVIRPAKVKVGKYVDEESEEEVE